MLIVVAYSGWDDAFTDALAEVLNDRQVDLLWCFYENDDARIFARYKSVLERVAPAVASGRFRAYAGIDCHSIFSEIEKAISDDLQLDRRTGHKPPLEAKSLIETVSQAQALGLAPSAERETTMDPLEVNLERLKNYHRKRLISDSTWKSPTEASGVSCYYQSRYYQSRYYE